MIGKGTGSLLSIRFEVNVSFILVKVICWSWYQTDVDKVSYRSVKKDDGNYSYFNIYLLNLNPLSSSNMCWYHTIFIGFAWFIFLNNTCQNIKIFCEGNPEFAFLIHRGSNLYDYNCTLFVFKFIDLSDKTAVIDRKELILFNLFILFSSNLMIF